MNWRISCRRARLNYAPGRRGSVTKMTTPLLQMQSITKDFPGVRALDDVSFEVRAGESHALCGENGAGKSTLIKILGAVHPHGTYDGQLRIDGEEQRFHTVRDAEHVGIAIIHQELALIPEMTVAENIYLGQEPRRFGIIDTHRLHRDAAQLLSQFGLTLPLQTPVHELGIGQQQLVEIAKALSRNARLLVLDEPTAALTQSEVEVLRHILAQLQEKGVACIYITHKLKEIFQVADRVTVLRDGKTVATQSVAECTEAMLISQMVGREFSRDARFPKRAGGAHRQKQVALRVENLSTDAPEPPRLESINFEVHRGEILGLAGLMGAGRTELINVIFGAHSGRWSGDITISGNPAAIHSPRDAIRHKMGLVSEDRKRYGLILDADVTRNMTLANLSASERIINRSAEFEKCNRYVDSLRIKAASLNVPVSHLSGGNQQKVVLGKWLMTQPDILFLDEPTRGIDVGAKAEIHTLIAQLAAEGLAIVLVSSELPEILGISDRILVLHEGKLTGEFINDNVTQEDILRCATRADNG